MDSVGALPPEPRDSFVLGANQTLTLDPSVFVPLDNRFIEGPPPGLPNVL